MKFAFLVPQATGGVLSVCDELRRQFQNLGAKVVFVSPDAPLSMFAEIERNAPDFVLCNVLSSPQVHNLLFYLPPPIRLAIIVHNITPMTYRAAAALRPQADLVIGVSERIRRDLIRHYGFDPERTLAIPNGVGPDAFRDLRPPNPGPLRVLYLGRIEEHAKGIKYLAPIISRAANCQFTIAGDGPDLPALRRTIAARGLSARVKFLGAVASHQVPEIAAAHHAVLLTSRFEGGCPLAVLESMAAGCVPVASRIAGCTDTAITHGENGFLFPVGATRPAVRYLAALAADRKLHARLRERAIETVRERFTASRQAVSYLDAFRRASPIPTRLSFPLECWRIHDQLRPGWWHCLPAPVKNSLRVLRERACCL